MIEDEPYTPPKHIPRSPSSIQSAPMKGFRPAKRSKAKLRLAITGPAGSGKTASALLIARGLTDSWEKIGMVDTEAGSGELYVGWWKCREPDDEEMESSLVEGEVVS